MAKQQKAKQDQAKNSKGHGKQNPVNMGSVGKSSELARGGRTRKRNQARLLEVRRDGEREVGVFHARINEGRFTDLKAALRGEVGSYAYPGGNEPSIHFNVAREARKTDTVSVIRLEAVQRGHQLEGAVFDPKIFVPCYYVTRFGFAFRSRSEDKLVAATQELIVRYFAGEISLAPPPDLEAVTETVKEAVAEVNSVFQKASTDHKAMLAEVTGMYIIPSTQGAVVVEVFKKYDKAFLRVKASMNHGLNPSPAFLPIYHLFRPSLDRVTSEETYAKQFALFMFLRTELADLIAKSEPVKREKKQEYQPTQPIAPPPVVPQEVAPATVAKLALAPVNPPKEEDEMVDVTGHQPLTTRPFINRGEQGVYSHAEGEALAYFRRERIAGVPSFVLIAADDGHPLVPCLERHSEVHVHLQDLIQNDRPYGDIKEMRNARECVRQYLRRVGFSLGLKPKQRVTPSTQSAS